MTKEMSDRSQYYKAYYLKQQDIRKFTYYEKKDRTKEMYNLYTPYGGEEAYYKMKYKEFANNKGKPLKPFD